MINPVNRIFGSMAALGLGCGLAFLTGCHDNDCDSCDEHVKITPVNASYEPPPVRTNNGNVDTPEYRRSDRVDLEARRLHDNMYEPRRVEGQPVDGQEVYGGVANDRPWLSEIDLQTRRDRLRELENEMVLYPDRADRLRVEADVLRDEIRTSRGGVPIRGQANLNQNQQNLNQANQNQNQNQNQQNLNQAKQSQNQDQANRNQANQSQNKNDNNANANAKQAEPLGAAPSAYSSSGVAPTSNTNAAIQSGGAQTNPTSVPSTAGTPTPGLQPTNVTPSQTQTGEAATTATTPTGEKVTTPLSQTPSPQTQQTNPAQPSGTIDTQSSAGLRPATPGTQPSTGVQPAPSSGIINPSGPATGPTGAGSAPTGTGSFGGGSR